MRAQPPIPLVDSSFIFVKGIFYPVPSWKPNICPYQPALFLSRWFSCSSGGILVIVPWEGMPNVCNEPWLHPPIIEVELRRAQPISRLKPVDMKAHRNTQMYKYTQIIHIYSSTGENGYIGKQIYINEYIYIHICTTIDANAIVQLHLISAMSISFYLHQKSHLLVDAFRPTKSTSDDHSWESEDTPALLPIPSGVLGPTANGLLTLFLGGGMARGTLGFRWTDDHGGDKAWYFKQVPQIWMQLAGFQY